MTEETTQEGTEKNPHCPYCGHHDVWPISYGYPVFRPKNKDAAKEWDEDFARDPYVMGGCCVDEDSPIWKCQSCAAQWGRQDGKTQDESEQLRDVIRHLKHGLQEIKEIEDDHYEVSRKNSKKYKEMVQTFLGLLVIMAGLLVWQWKSKPKMDYQILTSLSDSDAVLVDAQVSKAADSTANNPMATISFEIGNGRSSCVWWGGTDGAYIGSTNATGISDPPMTHRVNFLCPTDSLLDYELQADCRDIAGTRYLVKKMIFIHNDPRCK